MRRVLIQKCLFVVPLVLGTLAPAAPEGRISYADFNSVTGLRLNGSAGAVGGMLRLAPSTGGTGSAWYATKQAVSPGFDTTFAFRIQGGADGFAFTIQNSSDTALGGGGGGIGYDTVPNSLAVEFDIWRNTPDDPEEFSDNHISVHTRGTRPNEWRERSSIGAVSAGLPDLNDGAIHQARVTYGGGILTVKVDQVDDKAPPLLQVPVVLDSLLDLSGGRAYVGFTAATGGVTANFDIASWTFTGCEPPADGEIHQLSLETLQLIETAQLEDSLYDDFFPQTDSSQVVWQRWNGTDWDIYFYDGQYIKQLSYIGTDDQAPQISRGQVVWQSWDGTDWEIRLFDGTIDASGHPIVRQLTDNATADINPRISNGQVAWQFWDGTDWEIKETNGTGALVRQLTNNTWDDKYPRIDAGQVAWGGNGQIFLDDGTGAPPRSLEPPGSTENWYPEIDNGQVAWEGNAGRVQGNRNIFLFDGVTTRQIAAYTRVAGTHGELQISGGQIVWTQFDGKDNEVWLYDGAATRQLTNNEVNDNTPRIDHGIVAWMSGSTANLMDQVVLYDGHEARVVFKGTGLANMMGITLRSGHLAWSSPLAKDASGRVVQKVFLYRSVTPNATVGRWQHNIDPPPWDHPPVPWEVPPPQDNDPDIDAGQVVWCGGGSAVYLFDGTTTRLLATAANSPAATAPYPRIDAGRVVWHGFDGHDSEIFLYDGQTTRQLTNNDYDDTNPQIRGDVIVWETFDGSDREISILDGTSPEPRLLTNNTWDDRYPQTDGKQVVWQTYSGDGVYDVYLYAGPGTTPRELTSGLGHEYGQFPQISNGQVVWQSLEGGHWEIFLYDGVGISRLTNNTVDDQNARIDNGKVVWQGQVPDLFGHLHYSIFLHEIGVNTTQLADIAKYEDNQNPDIKDGMVVWDGIDLSWDKSSREIFLYDGKTIDGKTIRRLTSNNGDNIRPRIDAGQVAWMGDSWVNPDTRFRSPYSIFLYQSDLQTPDIRMVSATAAGAATVTVTYGIAGSEADPFNIGFYRSADTTFGGDTLLATITISDPADRTPGTHVKTFTIGGGPGQVALPGAGLADTNGDYSLLVVADPGNSVAEQDNSPTGEDNTVVLTGVYHLAGSQVYVLGTPWDDSISIAESGSTLDLSVNGTSYSYAAADVTGFRARGGAGNDAIAGPSLAKPLSAWGGDGNDTLTGGSGNDLLDGGSGNDTMTGGAGNDRYVFAAAAAAETDTLVELVGGGTDWIDFTALPATTPVSVNLASTATSVASHNLRTVLVGAAGQAANLENVTGGAGNDTLTGNAAANVLAGNAGADALNGGAGNDSLVGGAGNDSLVGGAGDDAYLFAAAATAETDTLVELAGGGIDRLDFAALPATAPVSVNLASTTTTVASHNLRTVVVGAAGQAANLENVTGGAGNDTLTGNATGNVLAGGAGNDTINGGAGNDSLTGGLGADLFIFDGTAGADALSVAYVSATQVRTRRAARAAPATILEDDLLMVDNSDRISIRAGDGDDLIAVASTVPVGGTVDGGAGTDTAPVPASWTKVNCEG